MSFEDPRSGDRPHAEREGALDADVLESTVLADFEGTTIGAATVQLVPDTESGVRTLLEFRTPGTSDQRWDVEIGRRAGDCRSHVSAIKAADGPSAPREA